jgi:hypothetical protein
VLGDDGELRQEQLDDHVDAGALVDRLVHHAHAAARQLGPEHVAPAHPAQGAQARCGGDVGGAQPRDVALLGLDQRQAGALDRRGELGVGEGGPGQADASDAGPAGGVDDPVDDAATGQLAGASRHQRHHADVDADRQPRRGEQATGGVDGGVGVVEQPDPAAVGAVGQEGLGGLGVEVEGVVGVAGGQPALHGLERALVGAAVDDQHGGAPGGETEIAGQHAVGQQGLDPVALQQPADGEDLPRAPALLQLDPNVEGKPASDRDLDRTRAQPQDRGLDPLFGDVDGDAVRSEPGAHLERGVAAGEGIDVQPVGAGLHGPAPGHLVAGPHQRARQHVRRAPGAVHAVHRHVDGPHGLRRPEAHLDAIGKRPVVADVTRVAVQVAGPEVERLHAVLGAQARRAHQIEAGLEHASPNGGQHFVDDQVLGDAPALGQDQRPDPILVPKVAALQEFGETPADGQLVQRGQVDVGGEWRRGRVLLGLVLELAGCGAEGLVEHGLDAGAGVEQHHRPSHPVSGVQVDLVRQVDAPGGAAQVDRGDQRGQGPVAEAAHAAEPHGLDELEGLVDPLQEHAQALDLADAQDAPGVVHLLGEAEPEAGGAVEAIGVGEHGPGRAHAARAQG